ncbi:MAG: hypothetical protein ACLR23_23090 [Clostridia bacterium]
MFFLPERGGDAFQWGAGTAWQRSRISVYKDYNQTAEFSMGRGRNPTAEIQFDEPSGVVAETGERS